MRHSSSVYLSYIHIPVLSYLFCLRPLHFLLSIRRFLSLPCSLHYSRPIPMCLCLPLVLSSSHSSSPFVFSLFLPSLPSVSRPLPQLRFSESRLYTYSLSPSLDDDSGPPFALAFANMRAHAHLLAVSDEDGFVSFIRTDIDTELCADETVKQSDDLMDSDWEPRNGVKERESLYMCI